MKTRDLRAEAATILARVAQGSSLSPLVDKAKSHFSAKDAALLQELCFGVCRYAPQLEYLRKPFLAKPLKDKDRDIDCLIKLGMYQLLYTRIPDHAAISSCVEASRRLKKNWASKLVNGVLRSIQRDVNIDEPNGWPDTAKFSHPNWILELVQHDWPDHWQTILTNNNAPAPLTLRINQRQTSRAEYTRTLERECEKTQYSSDGITLLKACDVKQLPGFTTGQLSVQDEAAQLATQLLDPHPGQHVLDACCAPGGKTCHILESTEPLKITAVDIDQDRLARVKENLTRLKLDTGNHSIKLIAADLVKLESWWDGRPFDRILLDAPCSASGVIRRHPDIKLLRRASDIAKLARQQLQIAEKLWQTLKPGGKLLYATCSVFAQENEKLVQQLLNRTPDAKHIAIDAPWGITRPFGRQLFPQQGGHDGFYYAVIEKKLSQ